MPVYENRVKIQKKHDQSKPSFEPIDEPAVEPSTKLTTKPTVVSWTVMDHHLLALSCCHLLAPPRRFITYLITSSRYVPVRRERD